jgi:hypothetical protein
MALEKRLVDRDVLDCGQAFSRLTGNHFIHQQERVTMGKKIENSLDID